MKFAAPFLALSILLSGCIIFDKKSEAVTFHQFATPASLPRPNTETLYLPRALIPAALRRPNVVLLDDNGWVRVEDAHRWLAPLDRAIPEAVGRHLAARGAVTASAQVPMETHRVLLLNVERMEISTAAKGKSALFSIPGLAANNDVALLVLTGRLEQADGTLVFTRTLTATRALRERTPAEYVQAQSNNLADLSAQLSALLLPPVPSK